MNNAKIRYKYNVNYMTLPSHKKGKHIKSNDMIDTSKQYTLSYMIASKNTTTQYVIYDNKKQPLKSVISTIKYLNRKGNDIQYQLSDTTLFIKDNGVITQYKIMASNKLDIKKVDRKLRNKLLNKSNKESTKLNIKLLYS